MESPSCLYPIPLFNTLASTSSLFFKILVRKLGGAVLVADVPPALDDSDVSCWPAVGPVAAVEEVSGLRRRRRDPNEIRDLLEVGFMSMGM